MRDLMEWSLEAAEVIKMANADKKAIEELNRKVCH